MGLLNPHLDDDDCVDVWSARQALGTAESDRPAESHLRTCSDCRARYTAFTTWLDGMRTEAHAEADEIFTRDRLATQQTQIFRRLESLEHPARIIAFPRFARPVSVQPGGRRRWIAAAAAVGLITGVGLGQVFEISRHRQADSMAQSRVVTPLNDASPRTIQPVSAANNDDETFLDEPEVTSSQVRVPDSLQYLNAITPGARDYDPR
jgi:hypothetical protein